MARFLHIRNNRGQVAFFIALIFQVLFMFFAMVINVGLLVHHKINLQNSVDLAAYYAASKQAENLNAIAHINYQIRQSYKLLSWRYNIPGNAGLIQHPMESLLPLDYSVSPPAPYKSPWMYGTSEDDFPITEFAPVFCVSYKPTFENTPPNQNACRDSIPYNVTAIQIPPVQAAFLAINSAIAQNAATLLAAQQDAASFVGPGNFWLGGMFRIAHRSDNKNRRELIAAIANSMSAGTNDFLDLDGKSVLEGAYKTFNKNLAYASQEATQDQGSFSFSFYNSLADPACGPTGDPKKPPKWLSEILVHTAFLYTDFMYASVTNFQTFQTFLPARPIELNNYYAAYSPFVVPYEPYVGDAVPTYNWYDSIGVEKNPWCMAYMGISAKVSPKLPFMPTDTAIPITAKAFAKPFGGKIGPWYTKYWSRGSDRSSGNQQNPDDLTDRLIAPRDLGNNTIPDPQDFRRFPNAGRYPGDEAGHRSELYQKYMGASFFMTHKIRWENWGYAGRDVNDPNANPEGDVLSFENDPTYMWRETRFFETTAIAPDIYDITYYSIEPNFAEVYLPRINSLMAALGNGLPVRGDLGWRKTTPGFTTYGIKDQILQTKDPAWLQTVPLRFDKVYQTLISTDPGNPMTDWSKVLTSWTESSLLNYSLATAKNNTSKKYFANCYTTPDDGKPETQGNCIEGGRAGYSVKLVNEQFLNGNIPDLGGQGQSGLILNPPPANF